MSIWHNRSIFPSSSEQISVRKKLVEIDSVKYPGQMTNKKKRKNYFKCIDSIFKKLTYKLLSYKIKLISFQAPIQLKYISAIQF